MTSARRSGKEGMMKKGSEGKERERSAVFLRKYADLTDETVLWTFAQIYFTREYAFDAILGKLTRRTTKCRSEKNVATTRNDKASKKKEREKKQEKILRVLRA